MQPPKRVLCIMDLACAGRASLLNVLPTLAACGLQACCLPTTLLGTHLGGFGPVPSLDAAVFCEKALAQFTREGIRFDAIQTGYLLTPAEFTLAEAAFAAWPDAVKLVDPVLGDGGKPYSKTTPEMVAAMATLAARADILTPNATEVGLLGGDAAGLAPSVVATSMPLAEGGVGILCYEGGAPRAALPTPLVPEGYPGTGDLFAAALLGLVLGGLSLHAAAGAAAVFVGDAARATHAAGGEARHGVWFEAFLPQLRKALP